MRKKNLTAIEYLFEFDEAKSRTNEEKHGTDFEEAQLLWLDEDLLRRTARAGGEPCPTVARQGGTGV